MDWFWTTLGQADYGTRLKTVRFQMKLEKKPRIFTIEEQYLVLFLNIFLNVGFLGTAIGIFIPANARKNINLYRVTTWVA